MVDKQLLSTVPSHPTRDTQHAESHVHELKQTLKKKAAETKHIVADSTARLERRAKLNCQTNALYKMARLFRQKANMSCQSLKSGGPIISLLAYLPPTYSPFLKKMFYSGILVMLLQHGDPCLASWYQAQHECPAGH